MGHDNRQIFIKKQADVNYKLLECDSYEFHGDLLPSCEIIPIKRECNDALIKNDILDIISWCNFTECRPELFTRTMLGGALFQGHKINILEEREGSFHPLTATSPVIVYSSNTLKVTDGIEEIIVKPILTGTATQIVKSKLTQKQIDRLVSLLYWKNFFQNLKEEDEIGRAHV